LSGVGAERHPGWPDGSDAAPRSDRPASLESESLLAEKDLKRVEPKKGAHK
jgi:hypothetical protein